MTTASAPSRTNRSARARPIPLAAPVTTATAFWIRMESPASVSAVPAGEPRSHPFLLRVPSRRGFVASVSTARVVPHLPYALGIDGGHMQRKLDIEDLIASADDPKFITGIFNYCNRRCE